MRGIVVHEGIADAGHYYSLIKSPESKWIEFNDALVSEFDPQEIPASCFGGEEKEYSGYV